jgi:hypothetical protein
MAFAVDALAKRRNLRGRRTLAIIGLAIALAIATAGCGRLGRAGTGGESGSAAPAAVATTTPEPSRSPAATTSPDPSAVPTAQPTTASSAAPSVPPSAPPASLETPDLTAIQQLLNELDAALGADATADTDEGSSK